MALSTRDVARRLRTSEQGVHKLVQRGRLKATRRGRGKPVIYDPLSVEAEVRRRKRVGFLDPDVGR